MCSIDFTSEYEKEHKNITEARIGIVMSLSKAARKQHLLEYFSTDQSREQRNQDCSIVCKYMLARGQRKKKNIKHLKRRAVRA